MKNEQLSGLLEPVIEALGLECLGIEYVAHRSGGLLRIYIDHPQGAQREVTLDDCEAVSREVSSTSWLPSNCTRPLALRNRGASKYKCRRTPSRALISPNSCICRRWKSASFSSVRMTAAAWVASSLMT